jgi:hypothetical protein
VRVVIIMFSELCYLDMHCVLLLLATGSLRACLLNMREHPLQPRHWDDEFTVFPCSLRNLLCASAHIVSSVLGEDEVQSLVSQVKDAFGGHSSEIDCIGEFDYQPKPLSLHRKICSSMYRYSGRTICCPCQHRGSVNELGTEWRSRGRNVWILHPSLC